MDIFDMCYETIVVKIEKLYSNDPQDAGGETVWGIARNRHPESTIWPIVDYLRTQPNFPDSIKDHPEITAQTKDFYRLQFWNTLRCSELPPSLALMVFDEAINEGPGQAARDLQKAIGATVDGSIGDHTIETANHKWSPWMLSHFAAIRSIGYTFKHDWPVYQNGWMDRIFEIYRQAATML